MSVTVDPERERSAARWAVIQKYARPAQRGKPMRCVPSREELQSFDRRKETAGNDRKIIYDTREAAEACARELEALGALPQMPFACRRSRKGHYHLTTDRSPGTKRRLGER